MEQREELETEQVLLGEGLPLTPKILILFAP